MGAYNFLSRRLDSARAEQIILSGRVYTADEMHAIGVVDLVVEDGLGEEAVRDYVERNLRRHQAERAIYWARQRVNPIRLSDLRALVHVQQVLRVEPGWPATSATSVSPLAWIVMSKLASVGLKLSDQPSWSRNSLLADALFSSRLFAEKKSL